MSRGKFTPSFDVQAVEAFGTAFRKVVPRKNSSGVKWLKIRFFYTKISKIDYYSGLTGSGVKNNDLLHVLVDSREASVTLARIFYRKNVQFDLGVIEHIRPRHFVDHFQAVLSEELPQDCRNSQLMSA